jgi:uncharacterized membrane protein
MDSAPQRKTYQLLMSVGSALLLFSLLMNLYLVWRNVQLYRESQNKAVRVQRMETEFREWQAFFAEMLEYSKRQPAVDPILQKYMVKPTAAPTPAPKAR